MKSYEYASFFVSHAVAAAVFCAAFLIVPGVVAALLLGGMLAICFITGGAGGPMFFPILLGAGVVYAACVAGLGLLSFVLVSGLHLIRERVRLSWWVPLAAAFAVVEAVCIPAGIGGPWSSLFAVAGFSVYWVSFIGSSRLLQRLRIRLGRVRRSLRDEPSHG